MPVGSCLGGQIDSNEAAPTKGSMEVIMTSSLLNQADQFAFMQQTLLMQVKYCKNTCDQDLWTFSRAKNAKRFSWLILWKNARKMQCCV